MTGTFRPGTLLANSDGVLAGPVGPLGPPLDIAPGALAAWSLRKLSASYAGMAVNIRRSSDNATQDIGFVGNDFDFASFNTFVGGGSGFVATWYDQTGHGNNAVQGTTTRQPQLITTVPTFGGRPGLLFGDNAGFSLSAGTGLNGFMSGANPGLASTVCNVLASPPTNNDRLWAEGTTTPNIIALFLVTAAPGHLRFGAGWSGTGLAYWQTVGTPPFGIGSHVVDISYQWTALANSPTLFIDTQAISMLPGAAPAGSPGSDAGLPLMVGGLGVNLLGFPGHISEQIIWNAVPATMAAVRAGQAAYWLSLLPLEAAPGAVAAWSLRRLSASYAGMAVNVRRSSDNAVQDIGFVGNDFDVAGFNTFVGGGNGFVATWYDQSGNGRNATQGTNANQPQVIPSVANLNGKPGLLFTNAGTTNLSAGTALNGFMSGANPGLVSTVCNATALPTGNNRFWSEGTASPNILALFYIFTSAGQLQFAAGWPTSPGGLGRWQTAAGAFSLGAHTIDLSYQWTAIANNPALFIDGSSVSIPVSVAPVGTPGSETGQSYWAGNGGVTTLGFPGHIAEQIAWPSVPVNMSAVRNGQKAYWGTP
jgi:hypothetical protein